MSKYQRPKDTKGCLCKSNPMKAFLCPTGHPTECHVGQTCSEAQCEHLRLQGHDEGEDEVIHHTSAPKFMLADIDGKQWWTEDGWGFRLHARVFDADVVQRLRDPVRANDLPPKHEAVQLISTFNGKADYVPMHLELHREADADPGGTVRISFGGTPLSGYMTYRARDLHQAYLLLKRMVTALERDPSALKPRPRAEAEGLTSEELGPRLMEECRELKLTIPFTGVEVSQLLMALGIRRVLASGAVTPPMASEVDDLVKQIEHQLGRAEWPAIWAHADASFTMDGPSDEMRNRLQLVEAAELVKKEYPLSFSAIKVLTISGLLAVIVQLEGEVPEEARIHAFELNRKLLNASEQYPHLHESVRRGFDSAFNMSE